MSEHYLQSFFDPKSITLIGASSRENTLAFFITNHLIEAYTGHLQLVNPHHKKIDRLECYKNIKELPTVDDLAIILTPIRTIPKIIKECGKKGIKNVLIMTRYQYGKSSENHSNIQKILNNAKKAEVRIVGPNGANLIRSASHLKATHNNNPIQAGELALLTQSASLCNTILDWAEAQNIGFSSVISHGMELDLCLADSLDFLANDPHTSSIIIQLDQVVYSRRFMSALSAAANQKQVVILKSKQNSGCYSDVLTKVTNPKAMDDVFHVAVTRAGADRVYTLSSLYAAAKVLSSKQKTQGTKLGIISNGRGSILLAQDRMQHFGLQLPQLDSKLIDSLKEHISWNSENALLLSNPTALSNGINTAESLAIVTKAMLASEQIDAIVMLFSPESFTEPVEMADSLIKATRNENKPILAVWMGGTLIDAGRKHLISQKLSNYRTPESAVDAFNFLCTHLKNQQRFLQVTLPLEKRFSVNINVAKQIIDECLKNNQHVLSPAKSQQLLESFHIPCESASDSPLTVSTESQELMLRIVNDPAFGPVICLGSSLSPSQGKLSLQLPPLNKSLSNDLIDQAPFCKKLSTEAYEKLTEVLIRVSEISCELPEVFELTINLLIVNKQSLVVKDSHIVIQKANPQKQRYDHLAIHPYPVEWVRLVDLKNDIQVEIRPIRPEDAQAEANFVHNLSSESKFSRFMSGVNDLSPKMLSRFTKFNYDREMAFAAFTFNEGSEEEREDGNEDDSKEDSEKGKAENEEIMLGVSRYAINPDKRSCTFAIAVADEWQGLGLAKQLMLILIEHAKHRQLESIEGSVLKDNTSMDGLMNSLGFVKNTSPDDIDLNIYRYQIT